MNWLVLIVAAYVCLALQVGLRTLLAIPDADGATPSFVLVLTVYVALMASPMTAAWAALALGLLVDLTSTTVPGGPIPGPAALGFMVGAYTVVQMRNLVFRESVVVMAAMTFAAGLFAHLVIVFLLLMRGPITNEPIPNFSAAEQMVSRFLDLLYTVALSIPLGFVLIRAAPWFDFGQKKGY